MDWKKTSEQLMNAHLTYEMGQFQQDRLESSLRSEIELIYDWVSVQKLEDLVDRRKSTEWIKNEIQNTSPSADTLKFFEKASAQLLDVIAASPESLRDLTTKQVHDLWVNVLIDSSEMRSDLSRDFAHSLFFRRLMSEVLFFSIRRFLSEDNILAKSIPGVSSLFKFGQNLVNQAMPNLDENVTRVIKEFVNKNMDSVVKYTENVLTGQMDEKLIRELADGLWEDFEKRPIARFGADLKQMRADHVQAASRAAWDHFRQTAFCGRIVETIVGSVFDYFGSRSVGSILMENGWSREKAVQSALDGAIPVFQNAVKTGALEGIIRRRLEGFYRSDAAKNAFS